MQAATPVFQTDIVHAAGRKGCMPGNPDAGWTIPAVRDAEGQRDGAAELIARRLSHLGATASGASVAYRRLDLSASGLTGSCAHLSDYQHVQELVLAGNGLCSLQGLGRLQALAVVDAADNQLEQVLDMEEQPGSSNLCRADLSRNCISAVPPAGLARFSRLTALKLDGNRLTSLAGLGVLSALQHLSCAANQLIDCAGIAGLTGLRVLNLSCNQIASAEPLRGLITLEVLDLADNQLSSLQGLQTVATLRTLDVARNRIRQLEGIAPLQAATRLSQLSTDGNPLELAFNARLHHLHMLPWLTNLNGRTVQAWEKVRVANMHGAAAERLRAIRAQFFPNGELEDGGGAVLPAAAGLKASLAEEEQTAATAAALGGINAWVQAIKPASVTSLQDLVTRLEAGCSKEAPARQLALAYACYQWVVTHISRPAACDTWDVDAPLFVGSSSQRLEDALLGSQITKMTAASVSGDSQMPGQGGAPPMDRGTWAERASLLFVVLAKACDLEAHQLSGFWKWGAFASALDQPKAATSAAASRGGAAAGWSAAAASTAAQQPPLPGQRLSSHNHAWAGVKVNGAWRLLDPAAAALRRHEPGFVTFYTPPHAFIYTHLPFESCWQLLEQPVEPERWWNMPEASPAFFASGMSIVDTKLCGVERLPATREGAPLPALKLLLAVPEAAPNQQLHVRLLSADTMAPINHLARLLPGSDMEAVAQLEAEATALGSRRAAAAAAAQKEQLPITFQQPVPGRGGQVQLQYGATRVAARHMQLWASFPAPGEYIVQVQLLREVPAYMPIRVRGCAAPLQLSLRQEETVVQMKAVVAHPLPAIPGTIVDRYTPPTALPSALPGTSKLGAQLVRPTPDQPLEADRPVQFELVVPDADQVLLGCDELGWCELAPVARGDRTFAGTVVMPRNNYCYIRASAAGADGWQQLFRLHVSPQVQHMVELPDPCPLPEPDASHPGMSRVHQLFAALDLNGDGVIGRHEMLAAFRANRQLADFMRMPAKIQAHDGSYDAFIEQFKGINRSGLGYIGIKEFAEHMLATTTGSSKAASR